MPRIISLVLHKLLHTFTAIRVTFGVIQTIPVPLFVIAHIVPAT